MARLTFPSRLELNRPAGSCNAAPLANVILTTFLYVSPVMQQSQEIERLRKEFGLEEEDLNLDLGPLGKLL